jgi:hypothetical protein
MAETLMEVFAAHDGYVSDKWSSYLTVYEELFSHLRNEPVRLLEIGVQNGGSLQIWRKYFRSAVAIVGCDIDSRIAKLQPGPEIHLVVGDIASTSTADIIRRISPAYDIIIDDGSHRSEHIRAAFEQLFPLVTPSGFYIAEDLACSYSRKFNGGVLASFSSIEFFKRLVDAINYDHWSSRRVELLLAYLLAPLSARRLAKLPLPDLREQVRSVRFCNSMCITEKAAGEVGPGARVVSGKLALVNDDILRTPNVTRYGASV